ncbi:MAG: endonuclease III [Alphaproteobacteria bacterium]|nr:endonuclease III [Alphaproteobacteria bacterium]
MKKADIKEFFARLKKADPEPKCELNFDSPYTLLVAIVLSAQTTDKNVNKATPALFKAAPSPEKMLALGEEKIKEYIRSIGLFNSKAKNIIALSKDLIEKYNGEIPKDVDELQKLAGVGRKTANVFLNTMYGMPTFGVDTHVLRLGNRIGIAPGKTPLEVEKNLAKAVVHVIPDDDLKHVSHWLVLHGRYICTAKKPLCGQCPVADLCPKIGVKE